MIKCKNENKNKNKRYNHDVSVISNNKSFVPNTSSSPKLVSSLSKIRNDLETDLCAQNTKSSIARNNRENRKTKANLRLFITVIVIIIAPSSTRLASPTHISCPQTDGTPETLTWSCPEFGVLSGYRIVVVVYTRGSCIHSILYFIYMVRVVVWCTTTMAYRKTEVRRESEKKIILITTARATQHIKRLAAKDIVPRAGGDDVAVCARARSDASSADVGCGAGAVVG